MRALSPEVLIIVHPTSPWEFLMEVRRDLRRMTCGRAEIILERLVECLRRNPRLPCLLVGPYTAEPETLPMPVGRHLLRLRQRADWEISGGEDAAALQVAGAAIADHWPNPCRLRICGFWRDLCCDEVAAGARRVGRHLVVLDRTLSRVCPPSEG